MQEIAKKRTQPKTPAEDAVVNFVKNIRKRDKEARVDPSVVRAARSWCRLFSLALFDLVLSDCLTYVVAHADRCIDLCGFKTNVAAIGSQQRNQNCCSFPRCFLPSRLKGRSWSQDCLAFTKLASAASFRRVGLVFFCYSRH